MTIGEGLVLKFAIQVSEEEVEKEIQALLKNDSKLKEGNCWWALLLRIHDINHSSVGTTRSLKFNMRRRCLQFFGTNREISCCGKIEERPRCDWGTEICGWKNGLVYLDLGVLFEMDRIRKLTVSCSCGSFHSSVGGAAGPEDWSGHSPSEEESPHRRQEKGRKEGEERWPETNPSHLPFFLHFRLLTVGHLQMFLTVFPTILSRTVSIILPRVRISRRTRYAH